MITIPWYFLLAGALALIVLVIMARRAARAAAHLQTSRDQALSDGRRAYAQGHEDGLNDAYRRVEGESRNANRAYDNGYESGKRDGVEMRRAGRRTISA